MMASRLCSLVVLAVAALAGGIGAAEKALAPPAAESKDPVLSEARQAQSKGPVLSEARRAESKERIDYNRQIRP